MLRLLAVSVEDAVPQFREAPNQSLDLLKPPDEVSPGPREHPVVVASPSMHRAIHLKMALRKTALRKTAGEKMLPLQGLPGEVSTAKLFSSPRPRPAS